MLFFCIFIPKKQIMKNGDILICASSGSKNLVGKAAQANYDLFIKKNNLWKDEKILMEVNKEVTLYLKKRSTASRWPSVSKRPSAISSCVKDDSNSR